MGKKQKAKGPLRRWRVNFHDKNSDECRSLTVEATNEAAAETEAEAEADNRDWPASFKIGDTERL